MVVKIEFEPDGDSFPIDEPVEIYRAGNEAEPLPVADEYGIVVDADSWSHPKSAGRRDSNISKKFNETGKSCVELRPTKTGIDLVDHGKRTETEVERPTKGRTTVEKSEPVTLENDSVIHLTSRTSITVSVPRSKLDKRLLWSREVSERIDNIRILLKQNADYDRIDSSLRNFKQTYLDTEVYGFLEDISSYSDCLSGLKDVRIDWVQERPQTTFRNPGHRKAVYEQVKQFLETLEALKTHVDHERETDD